MAKSESTHEYLFAMKALSLQGDIDDESLIQYVIDGIRDTKVNKQILYGANTIKDLKEKLKCYEKYNCREKSDDAINQKFDKKQVSGNCEYRKQNLIISRLIAKTS